MPANIMPQGLANQSLREHDVGAATESITYPAIVQCFAIAGWTGGSIMGTHISPDFSKDDIDDCFVALGNLGGKNVMFWYVVGPFLDHFAVTKAQWHSAQDIKNTFKTHFNNSKALHMILDASVERSAKRTAEGLDYPFAAIDIKAHISFLTVAFSYRGWGGQPRPWTRFDSKKFVRF